MKHYIILITFVTASIFSYAQTPNIGVIRSGNSYTNDHAFKVYYMPESKVIKFLDLQTKSEIDSIRLLKYKALTADYQERFYLADSTFRLKQMEADLWYTKLLANDTTLLNEKKKTIQLTAENDKLRKSRLYFFIAGVLTTSVVYIAVK